MSRSVCMFAACLLVIGVQAQWAHAQKAEAKLAPTQGNDVKGTVTFTQNDGKTRVVANVTGLKPGKHGFHIHEKGDCSAPDASSAGGHFNPGGHKHGAPEAAEHHSGDLGNIEADAKGRARLNRTVDFLTVADGPNSVVGKAVIVHAQEDDLQTQPTGNAGGRLACGVIEKK
jgi:Cu-Zn family superoxide dismutase